MSKIDEKTAKSLIETELNFLNLFKLTYCLIKAYVIWFYYKSLRVTKADHFITLVKIFVCNVKARINNNNSQRKHLLQWIRSKVKEPLLVSNFKEDWKDGILLCALCEGIVPGCCPRFDLLNPDQAIDNLNLGLSLIKKYLNIDSPIRSQEIHDCIEEAKLVYLLSRIKFESIKQLMKSLLKRPIIQVKDNSGNNHKIFESLFGNEKACFAKGMGLILGVRTRRSKFNIFCKPTSKLNLIIEINGPNNTLCSERIHVYNPKKRVSADVVTGSLIADYLKRKKTTEDILKIPFFYEVLANRIVVTYIPLMVGIHKLSIIWQGQHILNSPYTVKIEDSAIDRMRAPEPGSVGSTSTKFVPGLQYPVPALARSHSISLDDCATVVTRKVIKQTVVINGKQEVINDFNKEIINTTNDFNDNFANNERETKNQYKKQNSIEFQTNSSKVVSNSRKTNHLLNKNIELMDIKEYESLDDIDLHKSNQNIDFKHKFQTINNFKEPNNLSNHMKTNNISENNEEIVTKSSTFMTYNNYCIKPYIPVKSMIENWERLSNNVNQDFNKTFYERNKLPNIQMPNIQVPNRYVEFDKIDSTVDTLNQRQDFSDNKQNNSIDCENTEKPKVLTKKEVQYEEPLPEIVVSNVPESQQSQPDSGIATNMLMDFKNNFLNHKLLRQKSQSFPNLKRINSKVSLNSDKEMADNLQNSETMASSICGQYIDDEIPDYSNLFMGQYISYTGLLNNERPVTLENIHFNDIFDDINDLNENKDLFFEQDLGIYPDKCEVFGAGAYYGQVGVKNHFVVSTKNGGKSYLAVGVQSSDTGDVIEVSFTSIGQNKYEVQYEVSRPGYYVIFVKWGDYNIADSPFICKVTF